MSEQGVSILIVEDDMIIAANISLQLTKLGYTVAGIIPDGEEAVRFLHTHEVDILLLDINLRGQMDGIQVAKTAKLRSDAPVIFLTANADEATFNRARITQPHAFISKPFKKLDLQRAIDLAAGRRTGQPAADNPPEVEEAPIILEDRIFVRQKGKMVKVFIADILYAEADRNYCRIFTQDQAYLLGSPLKSLEAKLPTAHFLRIHRSYVINITKIEAIGEQFTHVSIGKQTLPVSEPFQAALARRLKTI